MERIVIVWKSLIDSKVLKLTYQIIKIGSDSVGNIWNFHVTHIFISVGIVTVLFSSSLCLASPLTLNTIQIKILEKVSFPFVVSCVCECLLCHIDMHQLNFLIFHVQQPTTSSAFIYTRTYRKECDSNQNKLPKKKMLSLVVGYIESHRNCVVYTPPFHPWFWSVFAREHFLIIIFFYSIHPQTGDFFLSNNSLNSVIVFSLLIISLLLFFNLSFRW